MKYLISAFTVFLIMSCSFGFNEMGYSENYMNLEDAWKQASSFKYISNDAYYWPSPIEFEENGGGDCKGFAIYLMYLLGPESKLVIIKKYLGTGHAIVFYDNKYIEPSRYNCFFTFTPEAESKLIIKSYSEAMYLATRGGSKQFK